MAMGDLIARLEAATGADRDLDASIAVAITPTQKTDDDLIYARERDKDGSDATHPGHYFIKSRSGASARTAPLYTSSVDAALTLVPEGLDWLFVGRGRTRPTEPLFGVHILPTDSGRNVHMPVPISEAVAETLPFAICIAALRARDAISKTTT